MNAFRDFMLVKKNILQVFVALLGFMHTSDYLRKKKKKETILLKYHWLEHFP